MRIPTNSTFTKEISKQFKRIFHKDMTLGGLQDLQEEVNLIIINEETNVVYDYDNTPALARKERA